MIRRLASLILMLVLAGTSSAWAQGVGSYMRPTCTTITSPVTGKTLCFDTTLGDWRLWDGTRYSFLGAVLDVRSYGAVCDGVTDDRAAIQAAITAIPALGGTLLLPRATCVIGSPGLTFLNRVSVRIKGASQVRATNDAVGSELQYSAATGSLISAHGARGLEIDGVNLSYSSATYTGALIDLQQGGDGTTNTGWIHIHDCRIGGLSTSSKTASALIYLNLTNDVDIERNVLLNAAIGIQGPSASAANANRVAIRNNWFNYTFGTVAVQAGGTAWTFDGNIFEPKSASSVAGAFDTTAAGMYALNYRGNWHGDATSGTWFAVTGGVIIGGEIVGNEFQGGGTTNGLSLGASKALVIRGNHVSVSGTSIDASSAADVHIDSNWGSLAMAAVTGNPAGFSIVNGEIADGGATVGHRVGQSWNSAMPVTKSWLQLFAGTFAPDASATGGIAYYSSTITGQPNRDAYGVYAVPTLNKAASGTHNEFASVRIDPPTIGAGASTLTNAYTLHVGAAPTGGVGNYSLRVGGLSRVDSAVWDYDVAPTYGANVTVANATANAFMISATNGNAFQINNPDTTPSSQIISITVKNASGGVLGAVTWDTKYKMAAWTSPANGYNRSIIFRYDGANWVEVARTPADVPN